MRSATILHIADVHLGVGTGGAGLEELAFERVIDFAIDAEVDALLVAGDLFDHGGIAEELLAWTAKQLDRVERPVILLAGNHDPSTTCRCTSGFEARSAAPGSCYSTSHRVRLSR